MTNGHHKLINTELHVHDKKQRNAVYTKLMNKSLYKYVINHFYLK